jgi:hypothetical protein
VSNEQIPHTGLEQRPNVTLKMKCCIAFARQQVAAIGVMAQRPEGVTDDAAGFAAD